MVGSPCLSEATELIALSPAVWPGPASAAPVSLTNPALITIPLGFLACVVGTLLSREPASEGAFHELRVRADVGVGAEVADEEAVASAPRRECRPAGQAASPSGATAGPGRRRTAHGLTA